jgi:nondiscriminating aspartyl-tRNA synthetase
VKKTRVLSAELLQHLGQPVYLRGWMHSFRALGKLAFLIVRDRSGLAQVVLSDARQMKELGALQIGTVVSVLGTAVASKEAGLGVEVVEATVEVQSPVQAPLPIEYYRPEIPADLEFILDHRSLALRNRKIQAVFQIQAEMAHAYRLYMHDEVEAVEYFSPNMIGTSSEGGAEFFNVDYFGYTATLAQSSQLYKQIMVGVNERVFALMPFFRAEPSHTPRHLAEGKQFEFEMGFFQNWHEILEVQEGCIKFILAYLEKNCHKQLEILETKLVKLPAHVPIPRLSFAAAQELYYKRTGIDERHEPDLSPAAERELCRWAREEKGTELVFVTDWKTEKRPFYSYPQEENPLLTNTFDLLCGGTEITSGGQRRHTYESMVQGIKMKKMDPAHFEDYLTIFKYGMPPHGGFGMGLERLTMTLLQLKNIREASLFPSDPKRIAGTRLKAKIFFGGENIRGEILRLLKEQQLEFTHLVHEKTLTSEESARVRGTRVEEGVKALIVRGKNSKKNYQFNLLAHLKLDMKAASVAVGEKCEFETPEVIQERFGLAVGGIPPFGNLLNLETFFDAAIAEQEWINFNCGLLTESVQMRGADLVKLVEPKVGVYAKPA